MAIHSFHPGHNASVKRFQEMSILSICNAYAELAEIPLTDFSSLHTIRKRIYNQRCSLKETIKKDLLEI